MKSRIIVFVMASAALVMSASLSHAITVQNTFKSTAAVNVGGVKAANVSIAIKDTSDPFGTSKSSLTWSGVTAGSGWKIADQLIVVVATVTDVAGGVRTYYDNTATSANPRYIGPNLPNEGGLLLDDGTGTTDAPPIPTAWSIKASTKIVEGGDINTGIGASDPNNGPETAVLNNRFQWLFHLDKDATAFSETNKFTYTHNVTGIHFGQADTEFGLHPDGAPAYMYIQADFAAAAAAETYKSSELIVESFTE